MYPSAHNCYLVDTHTTQISSLLLKQIQTLSTMSGHLTDANLFVFRGSDSDEDTDTSTLLESPESASNRSLLQSTYHVLKKKKLSVAEALTVWELRLVLLMFENQLIAAKKEAVNLNNALYLAENPNTQPQVPLVRSPLARADSASSRQSASSSPANVVYPLPKNNDGAIEFSLLLLILRLKLAPNLSLVNELYKLCYQLRLKGSVGEEAEIQKNLRSLSYEIIMVITITRNYYTLLSFLKSLESDLLAQQQKLDTVNATHYASNVSLMIVLAYLLILQGLDKSEATQTDLRKRFDDLDDFTKSCFVNVLRTYSPMVSEGAGPAVGPQEEVTFGGVVELVKAGKLTGRITCCTLASFEIENMYHAAFEELTVDGTSGKRLVAKVVPQLHSKFDRAYARVMGQWGNFIHKVYGIE